MRKYSWVMPEERDERFSNILIEKIAASAKSFRIDDFELEIEEKYTTEDKPHYHFYVVFGLFLGSPPTILSATYKASANEEQHDGAVRILFKSDERGSINQLMATGAFFLYDEFIREFYPEWETVYKEIQLPH